MVRITRRPTDSRARSAVSSARMSPSVDRGPLDDDGVVGLPGRRPGRWPSASGSVGRQHLRGQRGLHGVEVVAQRRPRHRLPAVLARQRVDLLGELAEAEALGQVACTLRRHDRVDVVALGDLDELEGGVGERQHRDVDREVLRNASARAAACAGVSNSAACTPINVSGSAPTTSPSVVPKCSTVPSESSGGRRLLTIHRVARSIRVRTSSRICVCTSAPTWLSSALIRSISSSAR